MKSDFGGPKIEVMRPLLPPPSSYRMRLRKIQQSGIFSNYGPQVLELESRFASRFGLAPGNVVALANATMALQGLVSIHPGKEWLVPSWTFAATALAVIGARKEAHFGDVDLASQILDYGSPWVHHSLATLPFGVGLPPAWGVQKVFPDIVDAAASLGNVFKFPANFPESSSVVFSLHATKYLGAGEGAIVACGSTQLAAELKSWSNFGFSENRESQIIGTNAKMSEFQAAVAHASLDREKTERRGWGRAREWAVEVENNLGIGVPFLSNKMNFSPYWIVRFSDQIVRDAVSHGLSESGIATRKWWSSGCHEMIGLSDVTSVGSLHNTEELARTTLGLPFHRQLRREDFQRISRVIRYSMRQSG